MNGKTRKKVSPSPDGTEVTEMKIGGKGKKSEKQLQKSVKKLLMEDQKLKDAAGKKQKTMKREDYIKNLVVKIDESVLLEGYGDDIKSVLENNGVSYRITSSVSGIISWTRKVQNTIVSMFANEQELDEKHYFLIIPCNEFRKHVRSGTLKKNIEFVNEIVAFHQLSVAVFGMEKLTEEEEEAVVDVETSFKCFWRFLKKAEDLAAWVMMATKSVAEIPYKLEREEKYALQKHYFDGVNKDTVRVDKNGNGLDRLWRQMLTMFPLVTLETAEAIAAVYPSPQALHKAYASSTKPEELLQDIPIRRAQGPLTTVRKIGPELSKKVYKFFISEENVMI